jgi:hypothetical protein
MSQKEGRGEGRGEGGYGMPVGTNDPEIQSRAKINTHVAR